MGLMRGTVAIVALLGVASPLQGQGRDAVKLDSLERQLRADSADADLHYAVAQLYIGAKRYDEADRAFRRAIEIEPSVAVFKERLVPLASRLTLDTRPDISTSSEPVSPCTVATASMS